MKKAITVRLSQDSIDDAIKWLEEYRNSLSEKATKIADKLSDIGFDVSANILLHHIYTGETISSLNVSQAGPSKWIISAGSTALLFLEFGAGTLGLSGEQNPKATDFGMGPGTYPGQTHAFNPGGWWYPTDDPQLAIRFGKNGQGYGHSYGHEAVMPMYQASVAMRQKIEQIAREVFSEND